MLSVDISSIVVFIIVWVLVIVLTRIFFKPLTRVIGERERRIEEDRQAGESASREHEELIQKIEDDVKQTRSAALATRQSLEKEAREKKDLLLEEVSRECRDKVNRARTELSEQVEALKAELEADSVRLAGQIEKKLLD